MTICPWEMLICLVKIYTFLNVIAICLIFRTEQLNKSEKLAKLIR